MTARRRGFIDLLRRRPAAAAARSGEEIVRALRADAHRHVRLPAVLEDMPGMIAGEERQLLVYVVEHAWRPQTQIIDGGSFLGASTRMLLEGLARSPHVGAVGGVDPDAAVMAKATRPPVDSFDLFRADAYMCDLYFRGTGLTEGDSFRAYFEENLGRVRHLVRVHEGDLRASAWRPAPISVLFLDVLWSWDINRFVMEQFYTRLVPEESFVLHQDYVYAWYPWIPVTMEYFSDCFEFVTDVPLATAVFRCRRPLEPDEAAVDLLTALEPEELVALMDRAVDRFSGWSRGVLECSRAHLLRYLGRDEEARAELERIARDYADDEAPPRFAGEILAQMDRGEPPRIV